MKATLPTALDSEHQKMLDELKAKNGKDFDASYDQIQLKAHQDAVALFDAYAKGGDNAELEGLGGQDAAPSQGASEHGGEAQIGRLISEHNGAEAVKPPHHVGYAETGLAPMEKRAKLYEPKIGRHENGKA